jgi:hypothetical protein
MVRPSFTHHCCRWGHVAVGVSQGFGRSAIQIAARSNRTQLSILEELVGDAELISRTVVTLQVQEPDGVTTAVVVLIRPCPGAHSCARVDTARAILAVSVISMMIGSVDLSPGFMDLAPFRF